MASTVTTTDPVAIVETAQDVAAATSGKKCEWIGVECIYLFRSILTVGFCFSFSQLEVALFSRVCWLEALEVGKEKEFKRPSNDGYRFSTWSGS